MWLQEDLENVGAEDYHQLMRAWELKHRTLTSQCVTEHTLFREETRWPGYYYRGDHMKLDDENWHCLTVSRRDPKTGKFSMEKVPVYHIVDEKEKKTASELVLIKFMDLLSKSDEEIFTIAKPFWENLVRASNMKDYGGFTKDFSTQMLFGANEVELGKQWSNNKIITNLNETY